MDTRRFRRRGFFGFRSVEDNFGFVGFGSFSVRGVEDSG